MAARSRSCRPAWSHRQSHVLRVSMTTQLQWPVIIMNFRVDHSPGPSGWERRRQCLAAGGSEGLDYLSLLVPPGPGPSGNGTGEGRSPPSWAKSPQRLAAWGHCQGPCHSAPHIPPLSSLGSPGAESRGMGTRGPGSLPWPRLSHSGLRTQHEEDSGP